MRKYGSKMSQTQVLLSFRQPYFLYHANNLTEPLKVTALLEKTVGKDCLDL